MSPLRKWRDRLSSERFGNVNHLAAKTGPGPSVWHVAGHDEIIGLVSEWQAGD